MKPESDRLAWPSSPAASVRTLPGALILLTALLLAGGPDARAAQDETYLFGSVSYMPVSSSIGYLHCGALGLGSGYFISDFAVVDGQLYYAEPDSPDLIAISGIAAIVDRVFMGDSAWKGYCSYCEQLAYELSETSSEEISKYFPQYVDRSKLEDTPLIIADENLDPRAPEGPGIPKKDARDIFFIPVSKPQEIIEVLDQINLARKRYP